MSKRPSDENQKIQKKIRKLEKKLSKQKEKLTTTQITENIEPQDDTQEEIDLTNDPQPGCSHFDPQPGCSHFDPQPSLDEPGWYLLNNVIYLNLTLLEHSVHKVHIPYRAVT